MLPYVLHRLTRLGVVDHALELDNDGRLISYYPGIVALRTEVTHHRPDIPAPCLVADFFTSLLERLSIFLQPLPGKLFHFQPVTARHHNRGPATV